jgi:hypothetical protein
MGTYTFGGDLSRPIGRTAGHGRLRHFSRALSLTALMEPAMIGLMAPG